MEKKQVTVLIPKQQWLALRMEASKTNSSGASLFYKKIKPYLEELVKKYKDYLD